MFNNGSPKLTVSSPIDFQFYLEKRGDTIKLLMTSQHNSEPVDVLTINKSGIYRGANLGKVVPFDRDRFGHVIVKV